MTLKIKQDEILDKALSHADENPFEMEDVSGLVTRSEVAPGLLTALLGGEANEIMLETNTVKYDELVETLQLPTGKRFDEYGADLQKDKPRKLTYEVGSFGLRSNVAPKDYANKRIPGTTDIMDEAYLISQMSVKADKAWSLFDEISFAQLLTTDTNIVRGGPMPIYNYYTDIIGNSRPAAIDMDLGNATLDHFQLFSDQLELLETDIEKTNNSMSSSVVICGKDFYAARFLIEQQEGLSRELRGKLDLASMEVPRSSFGSGSGKFAYQWFDSHDGLRYIRYSASILGTKLIADGDAYMIPVGANSFMKVAYAPAQTRTYVNTTAAKRYAWSKEDERKGVTMIEESNKLPMLVNPQLIRRLTTS